MAAMTLSLWPVLLWVMHGRLWRSIADRGVIISVGIIGLAVLALSMSQHETSGIALALSLVSVGLCRISQRLALGLVALAWIVSTLLVMPIVSQAYEQQLHMAKWLPVTARQRIIIWGYTAEQVPKAPVLGIGIDSGKILDARSTPETPPGFVYPRRTGTHSHNVYIQTWYELGAIGAVLLCALGLSILVSISRLPDRHQGYALATFVASAAMAAFSWGMWQPWFMAAFGIAALLFLVAAEQERRTTLAASTSQ
jgi:O-antigen ligase